MPYLPPSVAAALANSIYDLVNFDSTKKGLTLLQIKYGGMLDVNNETMLAAKTGWPRLC